YRTWTGGVVSKGRGRSYFLPLMFPGNKWNLERAVEFRIQISERLWPKRCVETAHSSQGPRCASHSRRIRVMLSRIASYNLLIKQNFLKLPLPGCRLGWQNALPAPTHTAAFLARLEGKLKPMDARDLHRRAQMYRQRSRALTEEAKHEFRDE